MNIEHRQTDIWDDHGEGRRELMVQESTLNGML
jgi:hypothetical protein